jgi:hypothetical protein
MIIACAVIYIAQFLLINSAVFATIVTKGNGLEGGFQDDIYFSRLLKCENKNHALIVTILNLTINLFQS